MTSNTSRLGRAIAIAALAGIGPAAALAAPARPAAEPLAGGEAAARVQTQQEPVEATGKLTTSPVLGPRAADGTMGGMIPSAAPGWQPNPADDLDAYVYVPGRGWALGDTRAERTP